MTLKSPAGNLALLQWLVVDVAGQCSLITIARRTRQTSSDKSATASNADRLALIVKKKERKEDYGNINRLSKRA